MSHPSNEVLKEEFTPEEIEAMPEPEIDNTLPTDQERIMEDKGNDLLSSFAD